MARPTRVRSDEIYAQLKREILGGELAVGMPLREVSVSERFGVSRTPLRAVLRRLHEEGLLERSSSGLVVRAVPIEEVIQIYELRIMLEGESATQAARSRREGDLVRLEALLARDRALPDPTDTQRLSTNLEFHSALWSAANNRVLRDMLERLATHLVHAPYSTLSVPGRWATSLDEHEAILAAVRRRDADAARRLAEAHMCTARDLRLALLAPMTSSSGTATDSFFTV